MNRVCYFSNCGTSLPDDWSMACCNRCLLDSKRELILMRKDQTMYDSSRDKTHNREMIKIYEKIR